MKNSKLEFSIDGSGGAGAFRKGIRNIVIAALVLVPTSGIIIMTFVGVYPWPDVLYVLIEYSAPIIVINVYLILTLSGKAANHIIDIVEKGTDVEKTKMAMQIKKRLPPVFFGALFLYTVQGAMSANLSLDHFHGYQYDTYYYLYTLYSVIPTLLISAFPIYFYLTDHLGRYLAPRGVSITIAPLSFKYTILGLFTPLLIDTVLLLYYYDRTKYLTIETIALWFALLVIAGLGTLLAWRSMMQSMSPIEKYLDNIEVGNRVDTQVPVPQSLDEIGSVTGRYADMLKANRQMGNDLSHERSFVNAVLENANALVLVLDKEGRIRRFNRACEQLTGYRFEEVHDGYTWDYFLDPKEADAVKEFAFDALANNPERITGTYTNHWISRTRKRYLIEWSNSLLLDANGEMEYMVSVGIDVTEKNKSERALIEHYQMQKSVLTIARNLESVKTHSDIIDAISNELQSAIKYPVCWLYIQDGDDRRYCKLIANNKGNLDALENRSDILRLDMHSDPYLKTLLTADDIVVVKDMRADPRTDKDKVAVTDMRTCIHVPLIINTRWIGLLGVASFGEDGVHAPNQSEIAFLQTLGAHVTVVCDRIEYEHKLSQSRDVLEQRVEERTQELKATQSELLRKERLATLGQLTATVSHELRNPLGAMRPSTYILRKKIDVSDRQIAGAIERIERGIDRCDHIIDELLDFTRVPQLEKLRQDLDRWVDGIVNDHVFPSGLKLELVRGLDGMHAEFDAHRLRRALVNILDNAVQAQVSEADGQLVENASLNLRTRRINGRVELILRDSGPGIPEEVMPKIFEPLFSTKNFGVGLGMSAVKMIMEQHEGGIDIDSTPGEGTTITLWLPATATPTTKNILVH